jgi:hypothetical protein
MEEMAEGRAQRKEGAEVRRGWAIANRHPPLKSPLPDYRMIPPLPIAYHPLRDNNSCRVLRKDHVGIL